MTYQELIDSLLYMKRTSGASLDDPVTVRGEDGEYYGIQEPKKTAKDDVLAEGHLFLNVETYEVKDFHDLYMGEYYVQEHTYTGLYEIQMKVHPGFFIDGVKNFKGSFMDAAKKALALNEANGVRRVAIKGTPPNHEQKWAVIPLKDIENSEFVLSIKKKIESER